MLFAEDCFWGGIKDQCFSLALPWKARARRLRLKSNGWERFNYFEFLLGCVFRASGIRALANLFIERFLKGNSGRLEHLSLEVALVEIHSFGAAFVHIDHLSMI